MAEPTGERRGFRFRRLERLGNGRDRLGSPGAVVCLRKPFGVN